MAVIVHTAQLQLLSRLCKWGITLALCSSWKTACMCHTCCDVTYLLNLFIPHLWPLYLPSSHTAICSVATTPHPLSWVPVEGCQENSSSFSCQIWNFSCKFTLARVAKGRQSQCQTHSSFSVGHIFNSVTVAEKGSWLPSERGHAQHCKRSQQLFPVQNGHIIKGFKNVKSIVSEKNSIIDICDILKTLHICLQSK